MAIYLVDTDILIDISKNSKTAIDWSIFAFEKKLSLAICSINIAEFYSGLSKKDLPYWDIFFEQFTFWVITKNISRQAGIWRYEFFRKGVTLSVADSLIAATAFTHGATIVTRNIKDYPMEKIKLLSI